MAQRLRQNRRLERLRRRRQRRKPLPHRHARMNPSCSCSRVVRSVAFHGSKAISCTSNSAAHVLQRRADGLVVDDVAGRRLEQPVARPLVVGDAVARAPARRNAFGRARRTRGSTAKPVVIGKHGHQRRQVRRGREVHADIARAPAQRRAIERRILAGIPRGHRNPARGLLRPLVKIQPRERRSPARGFPAPGHTSIRISSRLRKSPSAGFALLPDLLVRPVGVGGASYRIGRNVGSSAGFSCTFLAWRVELPQNRMPVVARGRDRHHQRLRAGALAGRQHVPQLAIRRRMELVVNHRARVEPVLASTPPH